ncbi:Na/Pi symporter [Ruficoccus sp. ZRK36]|uniref:Na/Pi cotransporter family protein n=1 Tax=Ruficoccus sp. ZRK36 TaxID=2866311 RepID=UPI001C733FE4|nr:Na/Pi symporter [Ruficoccus sp. ZRK36]QYY36652.1 Na/Pi symporter [Ruficoccus sp. ZRK36]
MEEGLFFIIGYILAGLGLFFVGIQIIDQHLKRLTGCRLHAIFLRLTATRWRAAWWGFWIGAVTQTAAAITFLTISVVSSGLMKRQRAISLLNWSNPGTCLLIFFLVLPLNLFIAYLVGIAGILYAFQVPRRGRDLLGFLFGMGLLFTGLFTLQDYGEDFQNFVWFRHIMEATAGQYLLVFAAGCALTVIAQSGNAVILVTIVLAQAGLMGRLEALMAIYGVNLGASLITHLLTLRLKGTPKQMAMFQVYYGWIGTLILVPLFFIEVWGGVPLVAAFLDRFSTSLSTEMAVANLLYCVLTTLVIMPLEGPLSRWLNRAYPPPVDEDASRPKFLYPRCEAQPETCLDLIEMEQTRLGEQLGRYLRLDPHSNFLSEEARAIHESCQSLRGTIEHYLQLLVHQSLATDTVHRVGILNERLDVYGALEAEFYKTLPRAKVLARRRDTSGGRLYEGFEAAALTVLDAVESRSADDIALALLITEDGSDTLSRLRQGVVETTREVAPREQAELLQLVAGVERLIWLSNSLVRSLEHAATRPVLKADAG